MSTTNKPTSPPNSRTMTLRRRSLALFSFAHFGSSPTNASKRDLFVPESRPSMNEKAEIVAPSDSVTPKETTTSPKNPSPCQESHSPQQPRSKTRTLLRILTTKIRPTSPPPPATSPVTPKSPKLPKSAPPTRTLFTVRAPAPANTFATRENREAALRERGLLPPLIPLKDLSRQELEHDRYLPVISPSQDEAVTIQGNGGVEALTAANLIKKEWEAKNRFGEDEERERFMAFKFGGSSAPPSPRLMPAIVVPDVQSPISDQDISEAQPLHPSHSLVPSKDAQHGQNSELPKILTTVVDEEKNDTTDTNEHAVSSSLKPPPLTPSSIASPEVLTHGDLTLGQFSPTMIPLPPSPAPTPSSSPPGSPKLKLLPVSENGKDKSMQLLLPPSPISPTPIISLSPVDEESPTLEKDVTSPSMHQRSDSYPVPLSVSGSISSLATPSLDTSSYATTLSTLATSESSPRLKTTTLSGARNIPMIVESPIEEGLTFVDEPMSASDGEHLIPDVQREDQDKQRSLTDPTPPRPKNRRKRQPMSKKGQTADSIEQQSPGKRLTVSASLTNMRRSVVNSLSRTKSNVNIGGGKGDKTYDASHLPPSPTFPPTLASLARLELRHSSELLPPRQPLSPTLHSRGSILLETSAIEDDEARRMTELAFLG
ncbi:hypothetical protein AMATHDRAFT_45763 [Amanita thiersii Skay4041]|uniref:Uncharacterized protein n=1 Tax=Amanita thiersii Skay4041 TaxID=703135 RepID=A0A2A9NYT4_9AGAR|nr:hypothetical protein AMATHDRAFT_45763 [Amanita thiersii Skay4041]